MQLGVSGEIGGGQGILAIADWEKEAGFGSGEGQCGRYEWCGVSCGIGAELMQLAPGRLIPFGYRQILYASIVIVMSWWAGFQLARRACEQVQGQIRWPCGWPSLAGNTGMRASIDGLASRIYRRVRLAIHLATLARR